LECEKCNAERSAFGFPKGLPFGRTANCDTIPFLSVETGGKKALENAKEKCKKPTGKMKILQQL
jgi:hypothetical protein